MDWGTTCSLSDLTEVKEKVLKETVPNFGTVTPNTLHAKHPHLLSPPSPAVLFPIPPIDLTGKLSHTGLSMCHLLFLKMIFTSPEKWDS